MEVVLFERQLVALGTSLVSNRIRYNTLLMGVNGSAVTHKRHHGIGAQSKLFGPLYHSGVDKAVGKGNS